MQSLLLPEIQKLVARNEVVISSHGYDELAEDNILVKDVLKSLDNAVVVEDYPDCVKGPCTFGIAKSQE